jgi:TonB family protein
MSLVLNLMLASALAGVVPVHGVPWVTDRDYPESARRHHENGWVNFTILVAADGQIDGCRITRSTGSATLDKQTCELMQKRARFKAARDEQGNPTRGTYKGAVRWVLPDEIGSGTFRLEPALAVDLELQLARMPKGLRENYVFVVARTNSDGSVAACAPADRNRKTLALANTACAQLHSLWNSPVQWSDGAPVTAVETYKVGFVSPAK